VISEVVALRMNEKVVGQLHSGAISMLDKQHAHINELEELLEGVMLENCHLRTNLLNLASSMEQICMQSVMCHVLLMHYVETHWEPIGQLFHQIGHLTGCGIVPPDGHCKCHIVNELYVTLGETGSDSPSSLPSLQSVSSSIDSIYYSPTFLSVRSETVALLFQEGIIPFIIGEDSLLTLPSLVSFDSESVEEVDQGKIIGEGVGGFLCLSSI